MSQTLQKNRLKIRTLRIKDIPRIIELHKKCFVGIPPWDKKELTSQIKTFPEGQIGVELDGVLVAISGSLIVQGQDYVEDHSYAEVTDHGMIQNHDPNGDSLYGMDIAVDPKQRGLRLSRRLYLARKELCETMNLRRMIVGGRIPGFKRYKDKMKAEEYVKRVLKKEFKDPVLTSQTSNGFVVQKILPKYLPQDQESDGYAVLLKWLNPAYVPDGVSTKKKQVRIASVQYLMRTVETFDDFKQQCSFFVETASDYRSDFILFPELLTEQLMPLVKHERPGLAARSLDQFTDKYIEFFSTMAIKWHINIIAGTHLTMTGKQLHNVAYLFKRNGEIERQQKIHITPSEMRWWGVSAGNEFNVFNTDCGKIAVLICYDVEFPELARIATSKGAKILFVPYNTDLPSGHRRVFACAQARAIENHVYVVTSGAVGNLPEVEGADIHYAESAIFTPSDIPFPPEGIAAQATSNAETMLVQDLDMEVLRRTFRSGTVRTWIDRRTDFYRVKYKEGKTTREI